MNHKADSRTAPAMPGLLNISVFVLKTTAFGNNKLVLVSTLFKYKLNTSIVVQTLKSGKNELSPQKIKIIGKGKHFLISLGKDIRYSLFTITPTL